MKHATTKDEVLDEILLGLADEFEAGNLHGRTFEPSCPEEFEPLRECLADMIAEGSGGGCPLGDAATPAENLQPYPGGPHCKHAREDCNHNATGCNVGSQAAHDGGTNVPDTGELSGSMTGGVQFLLILFASTL